MAQLTVVKPLLSVQGTNGESWGFRGRRSSQEEGFLIVLRVMVLFSGTVNHRGGKEETLH